VTLWLRFSPERARAPVWGADGLIAGESAAFVGRRELLSALAAELRLGLEGPRVVCVEGEAGVGKTSLVRAALAKVDEKRRVVWAEGAEEERDLPFGVVEQISGLLGTSSGAAGEPLGRARTGAEPLAVGADLLVAIAESPVALVLVVEDLHWVDEDSARALLFALRRLQSEPVVVVVTCHPNAPTGLTGWERLLADPARVRRIELPGLDVAELVELAEAIGAGRLDPETAQRLWEHTGGHPLHARALLAEVGVTRLAGPAGMLPAPHALATLIVARLGSLPPEARSLVAATAVLGQTCHLAEVKAVAGLADPLPACDAAIGAGLLEWSESQTLSFVHPLIRAAVYNDLALASRRALHLAAADVTSGVTALDHRAAAAFGADPELAEALDELASRESDEGRTVLAARHWRRAAALSPVPTDRDRRVLTAVEGLFAAGMLAQVRALRPEVEGCDDSADRNHLLACLAFAEGRMADAEKLESDAFARMAPGDLATRTAGTLGFVRMLLGDWEGSVSVCTTAVAGDAGWTAGIARYALALCYLSLGRFDDLDELHDVLEKDLARGTLPRCEVLTVLGLINLWNGDLDQASAELGEAVERSRAGERTRMLASALAALGEVNLLLGQWDDAVVAAELGVSLARDGEHLVGLQQAHSTSGIIHARCGRFDLAQSHIDELAALESLLPWWGATPLLAIGRAVLAEARSDSEAMFEAVAPILDGFTNYPKRRLTAWPSTVVVIDALLGVGDTARAKVEIDALDDLIQARRLTSAAAELARLHGRLGEKMDVTQAEAHYQAGIRSPGALPYTRARIQLALGRLQRLGGRTDEATQNLLSARAQFSVLGASPDLRLCNAELGARGQPDGDVGTGDKFGLTASELSVANLVAQRLTNREVAARLYISAKTVEYHLGHIFAKLNITSRRQLADRLLTHEPTDLDRFAGR
jgi:ATP/maltotriose-dependent transcriptional regulator MalT